MVERTAFVTGGTGFLGLNLIEQLVKQDWRVTVLHRPTSDLRRLESFPVRLIEGDVLAPKTLERGMPKAVDVVFHVAADTSMWSAHNARQTRVNVEGTRNVVAAGLNARAARLVHVSTWNAYGLEQGEISETCPQLGGGSWINYNRTKFLAEEEVRAGEARGLDAVIVNPAHIMGRYDEHGWARIILTASRSWLPVAPPGAGTFCHAEQVANALIAAADKGKRGQNYLLSGADASIAEVFEAIGEITGWHVPRRKCPAWVFRLAARANAVFSRITGKEPVLTPEGVEMVTVRARVVSDRAERELGYRRVPLKVLIQDCCDWLEAEGLIGRGRPQRRFLS